MAEEPASRDQRIIPYLYYQDGPAALEFLRKAFGFEERTRELRADGTLMHAEVVYRGNVVMLGTPVDNGPLPLRDLPTRHSSVMCYVDDLDAHFAKAKEAGATIVSELQDKSYGDRMYAATDPEGHQWYFAAHI